MSVILDLAGEGALDHGDPDLHGGGVFIRPHLGHPFGAGQAGLEYGWVHQEIPDHLTRGIEGVLTR